MYPTFDGQIVVEYDSVVTDIEIDDEGTPPIHTAFQPYVADGATYYLARKEISAVFGDKNADLMQAYILLVREHKDTFNEAKKKYAIFSMNRSTPPVAKVFTWYDQPESY
jgi:hypothetical protein